MALFLFSVNALNIVRKTNCGQCTKHLSVAYCCFPNSSIGL